MRTCERLQKTLRQSEQRHAEKKRRLSQQLDAIHVAPPGSTPPRLPGHGIPPDAVAASPSLARDVLQGLKVAVARARARADAVMRMHAQVATGASADRMVQLVRSFAECFGVQSSNVVADGAPGQAGAPVSARGARDVGDDGDASQEMAAARRVFDRVFSGDSVARAILGDMLDNVAKLDAGKGPTSFRFHEETLAFMANLQSRCGKTHYEVVAKMWLMPSTRTLRSFKNASQHVEGVLYEQLKDISVKYALSDDDWHSTGAIEFDEYFVRKRAFWNAQTMQLDGFTTDGRSIDIIATEFQRTIAQQEASESAAPKSEERLANHVLVFYFNGLGKHDIRLPVAQYAVGTSTASDVHRLVRRVVTAVYDAGLIAVAVVNDGASENRGFMHSAASLTVGDIIKDCPLEGCIVARAGMPASLLCGARTSPGLAFLRRMFTASTFSPRRPGRTCASASSASLV
mmetsp:Transcript_8947/g.26018  ORF Transcript_8947/g.26018 Transcript_8947/m.26018 type:complete len:459 (+) Transcript_8947:377-1753(+)